MFTEDARQPPLVFSRPQKPTPNGDKPSNPQLLTAGPDLLLFLPFCALVTLSEQ